MSLKSKNILPLGGIILYLVLLLLNFYLGLKNLIIIFSSLIFIIGLIDDIFVLKAKEKLFGQIIAILPFIFYQNFENYNLVLFFEINIIIFLFLFLVNAANLIDGGDGILGMLTLISLIVLNFKFENYNIEIYILVLFLITLLNLPNAKIYFGDSGAMFLGSVLVFIGLDIFKNNMFGVLFYPFLIFPVPSIDLVYSIFRRLKNNKNIFQRDELHIHHLIFRSFESKWFTLLVLCIIHILLLIPFMLMY